MKALLQAGHSGRVPAPPEKRFLISTTVWAHEKTEHALLEAIRVGRFYARHNRKGQALNVEQWTIDDTVSGDTLSADRDEVELLFSLSSTTLGEQVNVRVVRDGEVIHEQGGVTPLHLRIESTPKEGTSHYRVLVNGNILRLATNPIFVRR